MGRSIIGLLLAFLIITLPSAHGERKFFVWLTDVHADPYYSSQGQQCRQNVNATLLHPFGIIGCDPPYKLLESAAEAAASVSLAQMGKEPEFVAYTGDFTRHNQDRMPHPYGDVTAIVENVTHILGAHFPNVLAHSALSVGILGNDDSPKNYELNITTFSKINPWLDNVRAAMAQTAGAAPPLAYSYGGYFREELGNITVLSINTIIYSVKHTPKPPTGEALPSDPFHQFAWLRQQLEDASSRRSSVWILGHISPGIETYGYKELWHPQYLKAYLDVVQDEQLAPFVAAQLFGHVHADEIRIGTGFGGPMLLSGALSPVYQNNPSFRLVEYESSTGKLLDYSVYYTEISQAVGHHNSAQLQWRFGYRATEAYPTLRHAAQSHGHLNNYAFKLLANSLSEGGSEWNTYTSWYKGLYANDLQRCANLSGVMKSNCIAAYICALRVSTEQEYNTCARTHANRATLNLAASPPSRPGDEEDYEIERADHWQSLGWPWFAGAAAAPASADRGSRRLLRGSSLAKQVLV